MAATDYVTLDQLKEHIGLDVGVASQWDAKLANVITSVSAWIDEHCQRHFWQVEQPRLFEASNPHSVRLGEFNDLVSVTSLLVDVNGDGVFNTAFAATDYQLRPVNAASTGRPRHTIKAIGRQFPVNRAADGRPERVQVTGLWGWPSVPYQVPEACLIQAARIYKRKEAPEGIVGLNQFGVVRVAGKPDPDVAEGLNNLIHPQAAIPVA